MVTRASSPAAVSARRRAEIFALISGALIEISAQFIATVVLTGVGSEAHVTWALVMEAKPASTRAAAALAPPYVVASEVATAAPGRSVPAGSAAAPDVTRAHAADVPRGSRNPPVPGGARAPPHAAPLGGRIPPVVCWREPLPTGLPWCLGGQTPPAAPGWRENGQLPLESRSPRPDPSGGHRASNRILLR